MITLRIYADGTIVLEEDFEEYDHATPYYDDYETITLTEDEFYETYGECYGL